MMPEKIEMYDVEVVGAEVMNYEDGEEVAEDAGGIVEITEREAEEGCEPMRVVQTQGCRR